MAFCFWIRASGGKCTKLATLELLVLLPSGYVNNGGVCVSSRGILLCKLQVLLSPEEHDEVFGLEIGLGLGLSLFLEEGLVHALKLSELSDDAVLESSWSESNLAKKSSSDRF